MRKIFLSRNNYNRRLALALMSALLLLFVILIGNLTIKTYVAEKANNALSQLSQAFGAEVEIHSSAIGIGRGLFEDITVRKKYGSAANRIWVNVNLNPFRGKIGSIQALEIGKVEARFSTEEILNWLSIVAQFKQKNKIAKGDDPRSPHVSKDPLNQESTPNLFKISGANLQIYDENERRFLHFEGLKVNFEKKSGSINFSLRRLSIGKEEYLTDIKGEIVSSWEKPYYPIIISSNANENSHWEAIGKIKKDLTVLSFRLKNKGIPNSLAPYFETVVRDPDKLTYAITLLMKREATSSSLTFQVNGATNNLVLDHPILSSSAIGPIPMKIGLKGLLSLKDKTLTVENGFIKARHRKNHYPTLLTFSLDKISLANPFKTKLIRGLVALPATDCQTMMDIMPQSFIPRLKSFQLSGSLALNFDFAFSPARPELFQYKIRNSRFNCKVIDSDFEFSRSRLLSSNPMSTVGIDRGAAIYDSQRDLAAISSSYTSISEISKNLYSALIAAEDGGFWRHRGIISSTIIEALRSNLTAQKVVLGGSTITMQTVKNLFLNQDRTVSRKVQELFLSWHIENILPKNKILEIYANIIEFGPGIYGVKEASEHFFNKSPAYLTPLESSYLAAVLPSPKTRYSYYCRRFLSENIRKRINNNLSRMAQMGVIDPYQLRENIEKKIEFSQISDHRTKNACQMYIATRKSSSPRERKTH